MQQEIPLHDVAAAFPSLTIVRYLNSGGFKIVYEAHDSHGKQIALKLIPLVNKQIERRTKREQVAGAKLIGKHFASLYEVGSIIITSQKKDQDYLYFFEEFISGTPLSDQMHGAPLDKSLIKRVGESILLALAEVEAARIVHRDIKPDNIMISPDGRIVLLDFGIARHLDEKTLTADFGSGPLTPGYGAPEQIDNDHHAINSRTDLFALGVTLYEMAVGFNPFIEQARDREEIYQRTKQLALPPLTTYKYSTSLSKFVALCTEKHASRRPATITKAYELFNMIDWK